MVWWSFHELLLDVKEINVCYSLNNIVSSQSIQNLTFISSDNKKISQKTCQNADECGYCDENKSFKVQINDEINKIRLSFANKNNFNVLVGIQFFTLNKNYSEFFGRIGDSDIIINLSGLGYRFV